jgi:hypothetical protein
MLYDTIQERKQGFGSIQKDLHGCLLLFSEKGQAWTRWTFSVL